jgi:hypothetical protein
LREHIVSVGASATAAVAPHVLFERDTGVTASRALGTVGIGEFTYVDVMAYTTLFEGYSLGLVGRRGAHHMLRHVAMRAKARPGTRVALGCIGTGAIGDEQVYASPADLAEDVAIVRAAGAQSLALLDLGGILARPPIDTWLDAFATPAS